MPPQYIDSSSTLRGATTLKAPAACGEMAVTCVTYLVLKGCAAGMKRLKNELKRSWVRAVCTFHVGRFNTSFQFQPSWRKLVGQASSTVNSSRLFWKDSIAGSTRSVLGSFGRLCLHSTWTSLQIIPIACLHISHLYSTPSLFVQVIQRPRLMRDLLVVLISKDDCGC